MSRSPSRRLSTKATHAQTRAAACRAVEALERRVLFATHTWDGDTNGNWSTGTNWDVGTAPDSADDIVIFPAAPTNKTTTQDIAGLSISRINFTGGGYTIGGAQGVTLANDIDGDNTTGTNTVAVDVTLAG